jgi:lysophospholipase L1-like esterase
VFAYNPRVVLVMYGTNDSYVLPGTTENWLPLDAYHENLAKLADAIRGTGGEVVLMTPPRRAPGEKNGRGENPNDQLERYVEACRAVATDKKVRLVDHYAHWKKAEADGTKIRDWTTDGCHPNPRGHREMAGLILPVLLDALSASKPNK